MNDHTITNFNTEPILNEIDLVIKKGLNNILKDFIKRYNLLESTHKQIMQLPSVLNELNDGETSEKDEDVPIFVSIADMTRGIVSEQISSIEKKMSTLEQKYDCIMPIFGKILEQMETIKSEIKLNKQNNVVQKENIKLEIEEEVDEEEVEAVQEANEESEPDEESQEEQVEVEAEAVDEVDEEVDEEDDEEADEEADEEDDEEVEADEEDEEADADAVQDTVQEADEEADEEVEVDEEVEADEEADEVDEEVDEEAVETETEEDHESEQEQEEEEEIFEIEIDDVTYGTNNEVNGFIYELKEEELGEKVGYFKDSEPFFYADE